MAQFRDDAGRRRRLREVQLDARTARVSTMRRRRPRSPRWLIGAVLRGAGAIMAIVGCAVALGFPVVALEQLGRRETNLTDYLRVLPHLSFIIGGVMLMAGALIARSGMQVSQLTAAELRAADRRPPVLLLRSFSDDDLVFTRESFGPGLAATAVSERFERMIADALYEVGPLIAIGHPDEPAPRLGAARAYFRDDLDAAQRGDVEEWRDFALSAMDDSKMVVMTPGLTLGVRWELDRLIERRHLFKLLLLLPPTRRFGLWRDDENRAERWRIVRERFSATSDALGYDPDLDRVDPKDLIAIAPQADGVHLMRSSRQRPEDYVSAIREAAALIGRGGASETASARAGWPVETAAARA